MVAKGAVVGVFLDGHKLHAVIATLFDMGENIISELPVLGHSSLLRAHAHMSLVNFQVLGNGANSWILELVRRLEVNSVEKVCLFILDHIAGPCWISVHLSSLNRTEG